MIHDIRMIIDSYHQELEALSNLPKNIKYLIVQSNFELGIYHHLNTIYQKLLKETTLVRYMDILELMIVELQCGLRHVQHGFKILTLTNTMKLSWVLHQLAHFDNEIVLQFLDQNPSHYVTLLLFVDDLERRLQILENINLHKKRVNAIRILFSHIQLCF